MKTEESEFDPDAIIQDKTNEDIEDPFRHKPKLRNRKLQELPIAEKGLDYSSLCSIMQIYFISSEKNTKKDTSMIFDKEKTILSETTKNTCRLTSNLFKKEPKKYVSSCAQPF